jgi:broad specificity phosphatase PhoE
MLNAIRFVIVRLCECEGNVNELVSRHGHLTDMGRRQANATLSRIEKLNVQFWISPNNSACLETAQLLAGKLEIHIADEFKEPPYPKWAGLTLSQVKLTWPREWARYWNPEPGDADRVIVPEGESFRSTYDRIKQGLVRLYKERNKSGNVGIVTHGENIRLLTVGLLGAPLENLFKLRGFNGAVTIFEFDSNIARFDLINDSAHLQFSSDLADFLDK